MWNGNLLVSVSEQHSKFAEYVPQRFVQDFDISLWNIEKTDEDVLIVSAGPENSNHYWEAWDRLLDKAVRFDKENGKTYYLRMVDDELWEMTYTFSSREDEEGELE